VTLVAHRCSEGAHAGRRGAFIATGRARGGLLVGAREHQRDDAGGGRPVGGGRALCPQVS